MNKLIQITTCLVLTVIIVGPVEGQENVVESKGVAPAMEPISWSKDKDTGANNKASEKITNLGFNGYVVRPFRGTLTENSAAAPGNCYTGELFSSTFPRYCGDIDGCTARLVSTGEHRSQSPPVVFTSSADGDVWTLSTNQSEAVFEGSFSDTSSGAVLESLSSDGNVACQLVDNNATTFEVYNCFDDSAMGDDFGQHSCTIVFED